MGMKETKKMLEIIEKQYREANKQYNLEQQKKFKKECRRDFIFGALLFYFVMSIITIISCL